jgi:hypothetical protein
MQASFSKKGSNVINKFGDAIEIKQISHSEFNKKTLWFNPRIHNFADWLGGRRNKR